MPLTNPGVKNAPIKEKNYKLSDEKGLYLLVHKNGSKYWRMKYRFAGKEKVLALGVYPDVTLKHARIDRDEARLQLSRTIDPSQLKQTLKVERNEAHGNSFKAVALDWFDRNKSTLAAETLKKRKWILEDKLFPTIGTLPLKEITPPQILRTLRRIEDKGNVETANRAKMVASQIFRYAVANGIAEVDPTRDLKGALMASKANHLAALTKPEDVGKLLVDIDNYQGTPIIQGLLKLSPLVFQRPGEIRHMEWSEINFSAGRWEIPAEKMKMGAAHIVPLAKQSLEILEELKPFSEDRGQYVFPAQGKRGRPASDATVTRCLRNMGYSSKQMTAHGFRAMARTMLDEILEYPPHLIEQQISHAVHDPLGRAYNRTSHLQQRKDMMQTWADYLDNLKKQTRAGNVTTASF
ncbi:Prophage integrase IntS [Halioglobus japonicus]|nr:Prophage integrase IntS [Halioglobus japonicus]